MCKILAVWTLTPILCVVCCGAWVWLLTLAPDASFPASADSGKQQMMTPGAGSLDLILGSWPWPGPIQSVADRLGEKQQMQTLKLAQGLPHWALSVVSATAAGGSYFNSLWDNYGAHSLLPALIPGTTSALTRTHFSITFPCAPQFLKCAMSLFRP